MPTQRAKQLRHQDAGNRSLRTLIQGAAAVAIVALLGAIFD